MYSKSIYTFFNTCYLIPQYGVIRKWEYLPCVWLGRPGPWFGRPGPWLGRPGPWLDRPGPWFTLCLVRSAWSVVYPVSG